MVCHVTILKLEGFPDMHERKWGNVCTQWRDRYRFKAIMKGLYLVFKAWPICFCTWLCLLSIHPLRDGVTTELPLRHCLSWDQVFDRVYNIVSLQYTCTPLYYSLIMLLNLEYVFENRLYQLPVNVTALFMLPCLFHQCQLSGQLQQKPVAICTQPQKYKPTVVYFWPTEMKPSFGRAVGLWHVGCWRCRAEHDILPPTQFTFLTSHPRVMMMSSSHPPDKLLSMLARTSGGVNCRNCIPLHSKYS